MKAQNFRDDIPSILIDIFKDHCVLMFNLTTMQAASENFRYPNLVGEPLRLELNFTFLLNTLLNSLYWGNERLWLQLTKMVLLQKYLNWIMCLSGNLLTVSHYSSIGTVIFFPLTMFRLLKMTLLPF